MRAPNAPTRSRPRSSARPTTRWASCRGEGGIDATPGRGEPPLRGRRARCGIAEARTVTTCCGMPRRDVTRGRAMSENQTQDAAAETERPDRPRGARVVRSLWIPAVVALAGALGYAGTAMWSD